MTDDPNSFLDLSKPGKCLARSPTKTSIQRILGPNHKFGSVRAFPSDMSERSEPNHGPASNPSSSRTLKRQLANSFPISRHDETLRRITGNLSNLMSFRPEETRPHGQTETRTETVGRKSQGIVQVNHSLNRTRRPRPRPDTRAATRLEPGLQRTKETTGALSAQRPKEDLCCEAWKPS